MHSYFAKSKKPSLIIWNTVKSLRDLDWQSSHVRKGCLWWDLTGHQTDSSLWSQYQLGAVWLACACNLRAQTQMGLDTKDEGAGRWERRVRECLFHPRRPDKCQAEGDRGLQIPLWDSRQYWLFKQCLIHTHNLRNVCDLRNTSPAFVPLGSSVTSHFCGNLACRCFDKIKCVLFLPQVTADCLAVCECPAVPPSCPPGISSVPDGCGCCKVCAAQLNQDCHEERPCDHHKGLECNYGNDVSRAHGICRGTYHRDWQKGWVFLV